LNWKIGAAILRNAKIKRCSEGKSVLQLLLEVGEGDFQITETNPNKTKPSQSNPDLRGDLVRPLLWVTTTITKTTTSKATQQKTKQKNNNDSLHKNFNSLITGFTDLIPSIHLTIFILGDLSTNFTDVFQFTSLILITAPICRIASNTLQQTFVTNTVTYTVIHIRDLRDLQ
jgi:hypothetical protein